MKAILWHVLMLIWLAGLILGAWWVWPTIEQMSFGADLVASVLWLVMGTLAWIAAFNLGRQRYWRR
jgi:hypothetical protein